MTSFIDVAPAEFHRRIRKALKYWHDNNPREGLLDDLLIAHHLAGDKTLTRRQSTNLVLEHGMAQLAVENPCDAELLELRFFTCLRVRETRQYMHYAESTIYAKQNQAITRLAGILYRLEMTAWQERAARLEGRLGVPPAHLVGVKAQVDRLEAVLAQPHGPYLVSIEGIGGIGKTALATAALRRLAHTTSFDGFGWVSAQVASLDLCGDVRTCQQAAITSAAVISALARQLLPDSTAAERMHTEAALGALRLRLRQSPHLIVVDNLDTVIDSRTLLAMLFSLSGPSRFILTSRRRLIAERSIHLHCVPELNKADSLQLMRQVAQAHDLVHVSQCSDGELVPIYGAVGGNPLALMLVIGQTHVRALHAVIADLVQARTLPMLTLFDFILHQVWAGLDGRERRVLASMPLAQTRCLDVEEISLLCGLGVAETAVALQRLIQSSLIYAMGDLDGTRYLLHNLTRTFLNKRARQLVE